MANTKIMIIFLTFLLTTIVLLVLLAFVPGFSGIYTWLNANANKKCLGISISSKSAVVTSLTDAMTKFLNVVVGEVCDHKETLKEIIDLLPRSQPHQGYGGFCSQELNNMRSKLMMQANEMPAKIEMDLRSIDEALFNLMQAFMSAVCANNAPDRDKLVALLKGMIDAVCD